MRMRKGRLYDVQVHIIVLKAIRAIGDSVGPLKSSVDKELQ